MAQYVFPPAQNSSNVDSHVHIRSTAERISLIKSAYATSFDRADQWDNFLALAYWAHTVLWMDWELVNEWSQRFRLSHNSATFNEGKGHENWHHNEVFSSVYHHKKLKNNKEETTTKTKKRFISVPMQASIEGIALQNHPSKVMWICMLNE